MTNLSDLRKSMADLDEVSKSLDQTAKKKFEKPEADQRYWKLSRDEAGNGYATIRFLPPPVVDGDNGKLYVQIWDHGFHGPRGRKGPWYIEKSLTTIGLPDPVSEHNSKLWNSGIESNKDVARNQKRRLKYHSNILVINDPTNPDNNGKVFLFAYGKKLYEKIQGVMKPAFADDPKINPFDFWEGADFKLRIRQGSNDFPTYEDSKFEAPSPLLGGDEAKLQKIWESEYSLNELVDPKNFKTYDELKASLQRVLEIADGGSSTAVSDALPRVPANAQKTSIPSVVTTKTADTTMKSFEELLAKG